MTLNRDQKISFANQLRAAREEAQRDAEAFDGIIHLIERLGQMVSGNPNGNLGKYETCLVGLASESSLAKLTTSDEKSLMTSFTALYRIVKDARNDAMHQGAVARHLTEHAVELAIILEDALLNGTKQEATVSDYMVRNAVCAELWHPISYVRQQMLIGAFSYLPVQDPDGKWKLVSDFLVATILAERGEGKRKEQLIRPLSHFPGCLMEAQRVFPGDSVKDAIEKMDAGRPLLVMSIDRQNYMLGIVTAFDLM